MNHKDRLKKILVQECLQEGQFQLATGQRSKSYWNVKKATLGAEGACLVAHLILEVLRSREIQSVAIGGLESGATPITGAVVSMSFTLDWCAPIAGFFIRKERKSHGLERLLEGFEGPKGSPVVVIDDVCTSGGSVMQAIRHVESKGYVVSAVLSIVDREEGAAETLSAYEYVPLFTASELLSGVS